MVTAGHNNSSDDPLTEPLLTSTSNTNNRPTGSIPIMVDWPETPVPLVVPKEWQQTNDASSSQQQQQCVFQYDAAENLLKLVSHGGDRNNGTVIDVLDPEDVIGVTVEINMTLEDPTPLRATTNNNDASNNNNNSRPSNAPPTDTPSDTQGHAVLTIYAYPRQDPNHPIASATSIFRWCGLGTTHPSPNPTYKRPIDDEWKTWGNRYAFHRRLQVVASEDVGPLNALAKALRQAAQLPESRGRALVVVNPFSGPNRNAEDMYDDIVSIVLDQAAVEHDVCITTHPQHATERMAKVYQQDSTNDDHNNHDISEYASLICMGGDGIVYECLQGIHQRDDKEAILNKLVVGIVGAGTSNGMAKSIARSSHEQSSILDASFLIAKGHVKASDLSTYQTTTQSYVSFLTFSWAMMSSIDIESQVVRFLGSLRFDIWAVWCVLKMKWYRAKFSYLPVTAKASDGLPSLTEALPNQGWVTEEDDYLLLWASHGTSLSIDVCMHVYVCVVLYLVHEAYAILHALKPPYYI